MDEPASRKRGRPKGSLNKKTIERLKAIEGVEETPESQEEPRSEDSEETPEAEEPEIKDPEPEPEKEPEIVPVNLEPLEESVEPKVAKPKKPRAPRQSKPSGLSTVEQTRVDERTYMERFKEELRVRERIARNERMTRYDAYFAR